MNDATGDSQAFLASFLTHVVGITALAMIDCARHPGPPRPALVVAPADPAPLPEEHEPFPEPERFDDRITVLSPDTLTQGPPSDAPAPLPVVPPAPDPDGWPAPESRTFAGEIPASWFGKIVEPPPSPRSTEVHASVEGVIHQLTEEIRRTARQHPTRVIWLFDASVSLSLQREEVSRQLEKVLLELAADWELEPVDHLVCGFGAELGPVHEFSGDEHVAAGRAVRGIPIDDSGIENTFTAIRGLLLRHTPPAEDRRTLMIVFTDEVGNDAALVDAVATLASRKAVGICVVGAVAPFGEDAATLAFVEPDARFDQAPRDVQIEQGPETAFRMTLNIVGMPLDTQALDSGFGPYALARLCHATHGSFLALHPDRRPGPFDARQTSPLASRLIWFVDPAVMAGYGPDYRPRELQRREAETHHAKRALRMACNRPRLDLLVDLQTVFDARDRGLFVQSLGVAQQPASKAARHVEELFFILQSGERAAAFLVEPRWKASYDLAMGRILAIKTKVEAYNKLLANAKSDLRASRPDTNRWRLEPSHDLHCGDGLLERQAEAARAYLTRVVQEHPGTPWALVAEHALEEPLGYRWVEDRYDPPPSPPSPADPGPIDTRPRDDVARPRIVPKPQRDPQRI